MRIYLIRHGESADDIENCYGGIADFPLTDRGRDQAREVGVALAGDGIEALYSSPLARARESAELIAEQWDTELSVSVVDELQERNSYGVLSGVNKERAKEIFGRVLGALKEPPGFSREPLVGAEDFDDFVRRVQSALGAVVADTQARGLQRVAVVTHGKFTQALFQCVWGLRAEDVKLGAINVVDYEPPRAVLVSS